MALKDLLEQTHSSSNPILQGQYTIKKKIIEEKDVLERLDDLRNYIQWARAYPDLFVDLIKGEDCPFEFFPYQREFLRATMRYRYCYSVYPRAYAKSFLTMMALMLKAILYPQSKLAVSAAGKEQSASITFQKVEEICNLIPALANEIDWRRGKTTKGKNAVKYLFKNGSTIDIIAAQESSRGQRRHALVIEEAILMDNDILNEVIIPVTNVARFLPDGTKDEDEVLSHAQCYITTAGFRGTTPYERCIDAAFNVMLKPDYYYVMGGTYRTPVEAGLLDEDFVDQLKAQGMFNEASFGREYLSIWQGGLDNSFFSAELFDKYRKLYTSEEKSLLPRKKSMLDSSFYVLGVDVGRIGCTTEVCVIKVVPGKKEQLQKHLVNVYTFEEEDFEVQSCRIKAICEKFDAEIIVLDANGLGTGLVDFMTKQQTDKETGLTYNPYGIKNTDEYPIYRNYNKVPGIIRDKIWIMKANAPLNTQMYSYVQTQMSSGNCLFLIDEKEAMVRLMSTRAGRALKPPQRALQVMPFTQTTVLKEQMINLIEKHEGLNIILEQNNSRIKKDKFSAYIYGMHYIDLYEKKRRGRRNHNVNDFMFFS